MSHQAPETESFAALVERTRGVQPWRRVFHASSGLLLGLGPVFLGIPVAVTAALLTATLVIALTLDLVRLRFPEVNRRFFVYLRVLASPREAVGVASSTWYLVGAIISWVVFPPAYASAALVVLGLADPAASVLGRLYGTVPLGKGSVQGALVFTAVAWAILAVMLGNPLPMAGVALAVALAEIIPGLVDDNLIIPLVTGALLWIVLGTPTSPSSFLS
jgi:dolichol kinase